MFKFNVECVILCFHASSLSVHKWNRNSDRIILSTKNVLIFVSVQLNSRSGFNSSMFLESRKSSSTSTYNENRADLLNHSVMFRFDFPLGSEHVSILSSIFFLLISLLIEIPNLSLQNKSTRAPNRVNYFGWTNCS